MLLHTVIVSSCNPHLPGRPNENAHRFYFTFHAELVAVEVIYTLWSIHFVQLFSVWWIQLTILWETRNNVMQRDLFLLWDPFCHCVENWGSFSVRCASRNMIFQVDSLTPFQGTSRKTPKTPPSKFHLTQLSFSFFSYGVAELSSWASSGYLLNFRPKTWSSTWSSELNIFVEEVWTEYPITPRISYRSFWIFIELKRELRVVSACALHKSQNHANTEFHSPSIHTTLYEDSLFLYRKPPVLRLVAPHQTE